MKKYFRPTTEVVEALASMTLCSVSQENASLLGGGNPNVDPVSTPPTAAPWRY